VIPSLLGCALVRPSAAPERAGEGVRTELKRSLATDFSEETVCAWRSSGLHCQETHKAALTFFLCVLQTHLNSLKVLLKLSPPDNLLR